jgi:hypothetical protein
MATEQELIAALRRADEAGDEEAARAIARRIASARSGPVTAAPRVQQGSYSDPQKKQVRQWERENNPTNDMSALDRMLAGAGKSFVDTGRGIGQLAGMVSPQDVARSRELDAPLMDTGAGVAGNIGGYAAQVIGPGVALKAAGAPAALGNAFMPATVAGNAAQGAALGALQPTVEDSERLQNMAFGAAGGAAGAKVADKLATLARSSSPIIPAQRAQAIQAAREAGYVLPPTEFSPTLMNEIVEGVSGKIKTAQSASAKNQAVTNRLTKKALGIPDDAPLNRETLQAIRQDAGQAYADIGNVGQLSADTTYQATLKHIAGKYERAGAAFPKAVKSEVSALMASLDEPAFDAAGAVDMVRILRDQADTAFRQGDTGIGKAAKDASRALEDLIERNLKRMGQPELLTAFRDARHVIAKTYSVERALNDQTGDVSAKAMAALLKKGKPLSGDLRTIAQTGEAFPKATQALAEPYRAWSPLDFWAGAAGTGATGSPAAMMAMGLRPAVRGGALSGPYQALAAKKALTGRTAVPRLIPFSQANTQRVLRRGMAPAGAGYGYGVWDDEDR